MLSGPIAATVRDRLVGDKTTKTRAHMKKLALITALLLATSPVAAQSPQQSLSGSGTTNNSSLPNTGIICQEEMTATFCNVPTSPHGGGYGSSGGCRIDQRVRIEQRDRIAQHHVVHPALLIFSAGQRTVQLIAPDRPKIARDRPWATRV